MEATITYIALDADGQGIADLLTRCALAALDTVPENQTVEVTRLDPAMCSTMRLSGTDTDHFLAMLGGMAQAHLTYRFGKLTVVAAVDDGVLVTTNGKGVWSVFEGGDRSTVTDGELAGEMGVSVSGWEVNH